MHVYSVHFEKCLYSYTLTRCTHITDNLIYYLPTDDADDEDDEVPPKKKPKSKQAATRSHVDSSSSDSSSSSESEEVIAKPAKKKPKKKRKSDQVISPSGMHIYTYFFIFKISCHSCNAMICTNFYVLCYNISQISSSTKSNLFKFSQDDFVGKFK